MGELVDRVNAILNGEKVEEKKATEQRPWWWKEPLAFGELPDDVAIPMDKSHRIKIIDKKQNGTVLLCGKPFSEKGRTLEGWNFNDAVDVMSWAYAYGFKFRPEVIGLCRERDGTVHRHEHTEDIKRVEVYIYEWGADPSVSVKKGSGLGFSFDYEKGNVNSIKYGNFENSPYDYGIWSISYRKGSIIYRTKRDNFQKEFDVGFYYGLGGPLSNRVSEYKPSTLDYF